MPTSRRRHGVVLLVVLFFALLLTASIATFVRRAVVDVMIARNRDAAAEAVALARGGVRLAEALLLEDRLQENAGAIEPLDSHLDAWWGADDVRFETESGATLVLRIEDSGSRLNLNALFEVDDTGSRKPQDGADLLLHAVLEKVIDEIPVPPAEKFYDVRELADNLIDWVDDDDVRQRGGPEDDYYQRQTPSYRAGNHPLLSLDELRLVEGFDGQLVDALAPYVTVYPYAPGGCGRDEVGCGVNLNTAPPHVLALLFYDDGVDLRLAKEDVIRQILKIRQQGELICPESQSMEGCTPIRQIVTNSIFPSPTFSAQIFTVTAEARVGEIRRVVEAVVDRSQPANPRLLSWRAR